ncbi:MAG: hypothetical protein H6962_04865 [Chromatiaceae bacterium]|nr:hypothetical protein [Chromatiaceae bacterium]
MVAKTLTPVEYKAIHEFLESQAGIRLGAGKEYLVVSRLGRLLPTFGLSAIQNWWRSWPSSAAPRLQTAVVDAMTTNETFWFRDMAHFRILIDGVLAESKPSRLRVWSAAASTGQEAYTTAICLQDAMQNGRVARNLSYEIVGTDISPTALQEAQGRAIAAWPPVAVSVTISDAVISVSRVVASRCCRSTARASVFGCSTCSSRSTGSAGSTWCSAAMCSSTSPRNASATSSRASRAASIRAVTCSSVRPNR